MKASGSKTENLLPFAIEIVGTHGIEALNLASLARAAGLSKTPIRDRFTSTSELRCALWVGAIWPYLNEKLIEIFQAYFHEPDQKLKEDKILGLLLEFGRRTTINRAALETLASCGTDTQLRLQVQSDFENEFGQNLSPNSVAVSPEQQAACVYLLTVAVSLLVSTNSPIESELSSTFPLRLKLKAVLSELNFSTLPPLKSEVHENLPNKLDDNEDLSRLFLSCLEQVGSIGYKKTSTKSIANRARLSEGFLFAHFDSKVSLFLESTIRFIDFHINQSTQMRTEIRETYGPAIAEAIFLREEQYPNHDLYRKIGLEQMRLSWHVESVSKYRKRMYEKIFPQYAAHSSELPESKLRSMFLIDIVFGSAVIIMPYLISDVWKTHYLPITQNIYQISSMNPDEIKSEDIDLG